MMNSSFRTRTRYCLSIGNSRGRPRGMNVLGLGIVMSLLVNASGLAFDIAMGCCLCQPTPVELFVPLFDRGILRVFRWKLELGNRQGQRVHRNDPTPGSNSVMLWGRVFLEESRKTS